jgi:hypothetical protein
VEILGIIVRNPALAQQVIIIIFQHLLNSNHITDATLDQMVPSLWAFSLEKPTCLANVRNEGECT